RLLATGGDGLVRIWEIGSGREVLRLEDFAIPLRAVAFSPDGRRLASGGDDGLVRLWNLPVLLGEPAAPKNAPELTACWNDLIHRDAPAAFRAQWQLVAAGEAGVSFLETKLRSV